MTGFDTTRPNIARVYDYWLGGKDNFAVDRELARTMTEVNPGIPAMARANRDFIAAAVRKVAEAGVEQFLDLGAGLPTSPAVHEAARAVNPDAQVVYVDSDPVVVSHASALLATKPGIYALEGDLTEPDQVLAHPVVQEAIDWARPACVILAAVLHFADAVTAGRLIAAYADAACAGSWLAVSVFAGREETMEARSRSTYTAAEFWVHGTDDMARWLDGLDVIPPGICEARRWMSGVRSIPHRGGWTLCSLAVKPQRAAPVPSPAAAHFRLSSGESWRAPWPMYAALRDADPVHHVENGDYWVLSRHADVQAAVLDTARYSSAGGLTVRYDERAAAGLEQVVPLVMLDPPQHTEFRELIGRGYTPRRVAGIEPAVRETVRARLDVLAELGECDIVAELFRPVPAFVVASYLGVPETDRARFDGWTEGIVQAGAGGNPSAASAAAELFGYFAALIERRRAEPANDAISDLVRVMGGDPAGTLRILGFAFTMIVGGNDTATGLLGGAAELLTTHPGQRELLVGRPDLLPAAVEEMLRLTSPVQCLARTLTRESAVHGRTIPEGRKVLLLYGSANRDPRMFGPDAEEFDILRGTRTKGRHLSFAVGPHHCLGAAAARLQARVVLQELLARFPRFTVAPEAGTFAVGHYTRRYATLPFTTGD